MKPVHSIKNQYHGINAHLHSRWQAKGGWGSFHTAHITHLMSLMKAQLRPMGYTADLEQSVQIRRFDEPEGEPISDISIYDLEPVRSTNTYTAPVASPQQLLLDIPIAFQFDRLSSKKYSAIAIYPTDDRGRPVAWVELLSPSNKPGGRDAGEYIDKSGKLVQAGIVLVEIDYLHESAPTLKGIPIYRARKGKPGQPGAHPYHIAVSDPRPEVEKGKTYVTEFDVDDPIPAVNIPLNAGDVLKFDFGKAYTKTFEEAFYGDEVDYSQLPDHFDRYSEHDQIRIICRMLAVLKAMAEGIDLETTAPLAADYLPLAEALEQLKTFA